MIYIASRHFPLRYCTFTVRNEENKSALDFRCVDRRHAHGIQDSVLRVIAMSSMSLALYSTLLETLMPVPVALE